MPFAFSTTLPVGISKEHESHMWGFLVLIKFARSVPLLIPVSASLTKIEILSAALLTDRHAPLVNLEAALTTYEGMNNEPKYIQGLSLLNTPAGRAKVRILSVVSRYLI